MCLTPETGPRDVLTPREAALVALLQAGACRTKTLAFQMGIGETTLRGKLHRMYSKLRAAGYDVDNLASLAVWSYDPEVLRSRAA